MRRKVVALVLAATGLAAGCGAARDRARPPRADTRTSEIGGVRPTRPADSLVEGFEQEGWTTDFSRRSVALGEFASGGPPRDGIPPLDRPRVTDAAGGDRYLDAREPVLAAEVRGEARAYPLQIMVWHEIANDTLGGVPVAVTYCPLCNSGIVFDRRVDGAAMRFGTTGKLRNSDLVMWDRRTESWWQQFTGEALVGELTGRRLRPLPSQTLSWAQFKARYPAGTVLSRDTGFDRAYGANPYQGYDTDPDEQPFLYDGRPDRRLPPKERVAAVFGPDDETVVIPFSTLARRPVVGGRLAGRPFVVLYRRGVVTALDSGTVADGRDVGTVGAFDPRVGGRQLSFAAQGDGFGDRETGSTWDITGRAVAGPLRGTRLRQLRHDEQFWFALAAFLPDARLIR